MAEQRPAPETQPTNPQEPTGPAAAAASPQSPIIRIQEIHPGSALAAKKALVLAGLTRLQESGRMRGGEGRGEYPYLTAGDVYDALRPLMGAANLALTARVTTGELVETGGAFVKMAFRLTDGDSGEAEEISDWPGHVGKTDHPLSKAITDAEKSFLRCTFMVSSGSDDDRQPQGGQDRPPVGDDRDHAGRGRAATPSRAARQAVPKDEAAELRHQVELLIKATRIPQLDMEALLADLGEGNDISKITSVDALKVLRTSVQSWAKKDGSR